MHEFKILLLGTPEVQVDGESIQISRRINRALLYYLASQGKPVSRSEFLTLFWPEHPEDEARARLRESISRIGKALPGLLVSDTVRVTLEFEHLFVDVLKFEDLIRKIGSLPWQIPVGEPLQPASHKLIMEAVNLWRGSGFLSGDTIPSSLSLDNWYNITAQRLEHQYLRLLERLSDHARAIDNPEECLQVSRKALLIDQINENFHIRLLECLIAMGKWKEGLEHFSHMEFLFREEDLLPLPQTLLDLNQKLKKGAFAPPHIEIEPNWNLRSSMSAPFVGRKTMLSEMQRAFHRGGGIAILGEPGIGKTRLVQEFVNRSNPKPRILLATCHSSETILPFQPFIDMIRYSMQPEDWSSLSPTWNRQLSLLLPELLTKSEDQVSQSFVIDVEASLPEARARLLEAIRQVFLVLDKDRSILFCLDDAHWADEATLATIAYLVERPPFVNNLLVVTSRRGEHNPALETLFVNFKQSRRCRIIHLPYMDPDEIAELLSNISGYAPSESLVNRLSLETGGNPLYLLETLRALQETHVPLNEESFSTLPLTLSLRALISTRVDVLSPNALNTLQTAAVIGNEFSLNFLSEVSNQIDQEVISALEELETHQLIEIIPQAQREVSYRFIHSTIREILIEGINPLKKQWLHRQIANGLVRRIEPEDASQAAILARHYENALEAGQAFKYWLQAGQYARQLFSPSEAYLAFTHAEGLIPYVSTYQENDIYDLFTEWAEMAYEADDQTTIVSLSERIREIGKDRGSSFFICTSLLLLCQSCMIDNEYEKGLDYANQVIANLEDSEFLAARMEAYVNRGIFLYMMNQLSAGLHSLEKAISIGYSTKDRAELRARANAHYQIAIVQTLSGWPETGLRHARLSLSDFNLLKRPYGQVMAYSALSLSHYFLCNINLARNNNLLGFEIAERTHAGRMMGYLHSYRAMIEMAYGNLDAVFEHANNAIEIGQRQDHPEIIALGYRILGDLFIRLQSYTISLGYYQYALQASQEDFLAVDNAYRLGTSLYTTGRKDEGIELIQQSIDIAGQAGLESIQMLAQLTLAITEKFDGKFEQANQIARNVQLKAYQREMKLIRMEATQQIGEISILEGNFTYAATQFLSVAEEATRIPYVFQAIRSWVSLSKAFTAMKQPDPSISLRVDILLDQMENQARNLTLKPAFESYKNQIQQSLR